MKPMLLSAALGVGLSLLLPCTAHGQYYTIYCYSDAFFSQSSYEVSGNSRTLDYSFQYAVAAESTLYDPNSEQLDDHTDTEYTNWWAEAYVDHVLLPSDLFGDWYSVRGQHGYLDPFWGWTQLDDSWDDVYVSYAPTPAGEVTSAADGSLIPLRGNSRLHSTHIAHSMTSTGFGKPLPPRRTPATSSTAATASGLSQIQPAGRWE